MKLVIVAGLPGAGKSLLAETLGRQLGMPVIAKDWLEATLLRCELKATNRDKPLGMAGYELLTTLAERQFMLGQSIILDSVASTRSIRSTWRELAARYSAQHLVIECICSDEKIHRARLVGRQRNIPGWHELDWAEVERVKSYYAAWEEERLVLDAVEPFQDNLAAALAFCA